MQLCLVFAYFSIALAALRFFSTLFLVHIKFHDAYMKVSSINQANGWNGAHSSFVSSTILIHTSWKYQMEFDPFNETQREGHSERGEPEKARAKERQSQKEWKKKSVEKRLDFLSPLRMWPLLGKSTRECVNIHEIWHRMCWRQSCH